jgi:hypothetical protein
MLKVQAALITDSNHAIIIFQDCINVNSQAQWNNGIRRR